MQMQWLQQVDGPQQVAPDTNTRPGASIDAEAGWPHF
jgi:hypothetical protein